MVCITAQYTGTLYPLYTIVRDRSDRETRGFTTLILVFVITGVFPETKIWQYSAVFQYELRFSKSLCYITAVFSGFPSDI